MVNPINHNPNKIPQNDLSKKENNTEKKVKQVVQKGSFYHSLMADSVKYDKLSLDR